MPCSKLTPWGVIKALNLGIVNQVHSFCKTMTQTKQKHSRHKKLLHYSPPTKSIRVTHSSPHLRILNHHRASSPKPSKSWVNQSLDSSARLQRVTLKELSMTCIIRQYSHTKSKSKNSDTSWQTWRQSLRRQIRLSQTWVSRYAC